MFFFRSESIHVLLTMMRQSIPVQISMHEVQQKIDTLMVKAVRLKRYRDKKLGILSL